MSYLIRQFFKTESGNPWRKFEEMSRFDLKKKWEKCFKSHCKNKKRYIKTLNDKKHPPVLVNWCQKQNHFKVEMLDIGLSKWYVPVYTISNYLAEKGGKMVK